MKNLFVLLTLCFFSSICISVKAQDDESRQASGLPRAIGENVANRTKTNLSGKVTIEGREPSQPKPNIFVVVYFSGMILERRQIDDKGNYFVPDVPREGSIVTVEIDGVEVGRYQLQSSVMGSLRQDITVNAAQVRESSAKAAIISAKSFYKRSEENEKIYQKASTSAKDKKPNNAIKLFKQLIESDPNDFVAWTELGTLYFRNDAFSEAEKAYSKAITLKPDFVLPQINLGKLYLAQKQLDKSVPVLLKAVEIEPASADAQQYLGEAYLQTKLGSKAVVHFNEALRLAPIEKAEIHLRLAALYNAAGLTDRAVAEYKRFLEKVPNYPETEKIEKYIKEHSSK
jgi:tetratricopeptide (TPR) repeat protein